MDTPLQIYDFGSLTAGHLIFAWLPLPHGYKHLYTLVSHNKQHTLQHDKLERDWLYIYDVLKQPVTLCEYSFSRYGHTHAHIDIKRSHPAAQV